MVILETTKVTTLIFITLLYPLLLTHLKHPFFFGIKQIGLYYIFFNILLNLFWKNDSATLSNALYYFFCCWFKMFFENFLPEHRFSIIPVPWTFLPSHSQIHNFFFLQLAYNLLCPFSFGVMKMCPCLTTWSL